MSTHLAFVGEFERDDIGEWEREPQSAVVGVYEAAPRCKWTTEPPTHPGWFWIRPGKSGGGIPVRVIRNPSNGTLVWGSTELPWRPVRMEGLCWSDRAIQEPVP